MDRGRHKRVRDLRHGQDHEGQRRRRCRRLVPLQRVDGDQVHRRLRPQGRRVLLELHGPRERRRLHAAAYNVSEPANDKYELKSLVCSVTAAYNKPKYGSATTDVANRAVAIKVGVGEKVDCTFTNQRKTGTITVKKALVPATDTGKFDLQVDGKNVATQVGNNGYGSTTVTSGTHTVGEAGANLGDYVAYTSCKNAAGYEVAKGSGVLNVSVAGKDAITCTITNTRKTGTIVVKKQLMPSTDAGMFDLQVDGDNVATQVGDGGTGSKVVNTGTHTVGEAGANLADYTSSTACKTARLLGGRLRGRRGERRRR